MTDADASLPPSYFHVRPPVHAAALTYPFWHEQADHALALYELSLRYYVLGLAWAGSPYAHHSLGSCVAISSVAYAAVRGVPKREAGEDFYLLNKLRKLGSIITPKTEPVRLLCRPSHRVPFGTGPAQHRIATQLSMGQPFRLYHPLIFERLKQHIEANKEQPRFHEQFDAFKTLKFIHRAKDRDLQNIPWPTALKQAPFMPFETDLDQLRTRLFETERSTQ